MIRVLLSDCYDSSELCFDTLILGLRMFVLTSLLKYLSFDSGCDVLSTVDQPSWNFPAIHIVAALLLDHKDLFRVEINHQSSYSNVVRGESWKPVFAIFRDEFH